MKSRGAINLALIMALALAICKPSVAADDLIQSMERNFIKIIDDIGPAIVEVSATRAAGMENIGTGIIIDANGFIITTENVVGGANKIGINLADGRTFEAKVVGADAETDVALLKIDAKALPTAPLGSSEGVRAGSWIIAIGRSYGESPTLSFGIVNGVELLPDRPAYYDAIKINTSVSSGNSGGGVVDMGGKVVGIITAALAEPRAVDFWPLSSAIQLRSALQQAKAAERLAKAQLYNAKSELEHYKAIIEQGLATQREMEKAQMDYVSAQSKYEKSLSDLEMVLSQLQFPTMHRDEMQETEMLKAQIEEIRRQLEDKGIGENQIVEISKQWEQEHEERLKNIEGVLQSIEQVGSRTVVRPLQGRFLGQQEGSFAIPVDFAKIIIDDLMDDGRVDRGWLGIVIQPVGHSDIERLGLNSADGVIVKALDNSGPAAKAGLRNGDVIVSFNGEKIKGTINLIRMVAATKPYTKVSLEIVRDKNRRTLTVEIGKKGR